MKEDKEKLCFVQFLHPGPEHSPGKIAIMPWNERKHKRKFILANGKHVPKPGDTPKVGEITFWGEWEAPSKATPLNPSPANKAKGYPSYLQEPILEEIPKDFQNLQNTDPYVFGEQFLYIGCQQTTKVGTTQLRYLKNGSVILFGSSKNKEFILDTVFVVKDYIDHDASNFESILKNKVSSTYWNVTVLPWYKDEYGKPGCGNEEEPPVCGNNKQSYRLYFGATYENHENGMFSFFPCKPDSKDKGFARPVIKLKGVVNGKIKQGKRLNPKTSVEDVKELWQEVVDQVKCLGLELGTHADEPSYMFHTLYSH